jgi:hypothetical protein
MNTPDHSFGFKNEILLKKSIESITGPLNKLTRWAPFDYSNKDCFVELKSRNCLSTTYQTTMIGMSKIEKCNHLFDYYFFFKFDDGLFYWKFVPDHGYTISSGGRYDRGKAEVRDYLYVPVKDLTRYIEPSNCDCS